MLRNSELLSERIEARADRCRSRGGGSGFISGLDRRQQCVVGFGAALLDHVLATQRVQAVME